MQVDYVATHLNYVNSQNNYVGMGHDNVKIRDTCLNRQLIYCMSKLICFMLSNIDKTNIT